MAINPTSPNAPSRKPDPAALESARAQEAQKAVAARTRAAQARDAEVRNDSVDVSADAKALSAQTETRASQSSLPPDRLKQIGERLASGHYDKPEVIAQVARRLVQDPDFKA